MRKSLSVGLMPLFLITLPIAALHTQRLPYNSTVVVLEHPTNFVALPDGIAIQDGSAREEITAVRDNILRVRIAPSGAMPENASWAVLPQPLRSHISVTPESYAGAKENKS